MQTRVYLSRSMCPPELADRYVCDNMIELKYRSISPILTRRTAEINLRLLSTPSPHLGLVHRNDNRKHCLRKTQQRGYRTIRVMCPGTLKWFALLRLQWCDTLVRPTYPRSYHMARVQVACGSESSLLYFLLRRSRSRTATHTYHSSHLRTEHTRQSPSRLVRRFFTYDAHQPMGQVPHPS